MPSSATTSSLSAHMLVPLDSGEMYSTLSFGNVNLDTISSKIAPASAGGVDWEHLCADLLTQPTSAKPAIFAEPKQFRVISFSRSVGILSKPDPQGKSVAHLKPGKRFDVDALLLDQSHGRRFFRLANGRGWVAEYSRKDPTRKAVVEISPEPTQTNGAQRLGAVKKLRRGPFVVRPRARTLKGGPADGTVVKAAFFRNKSCLRGYSVRSSFVLPDGHHIMGAGTKRRVLELAPRIAPRLFIMYRSLQRELLQEFERRNEWDQRRRRWRHRAAGTIPPRTHPAMALALPPKKRLRSAQGKSRVLQIESCPFRICDEASAENNHLAIEEEPRTIENGPLAIEDRRLAIEDSMHAAPRLSSASPSGTQSAVSVVSPKQTKAASVARARALLLAMSQQRQRGLAPPAQ